MAWTPTGISILAKNYDGFTMVQIIQSLARELERLQKEIDDLKTRTGVAR